MQVDKIIRRVAAPFLGLMLGLAALAAQAQQTPPTIDGAKVVTATEVEKLMAQGVPVIDARVANEYADEHIKGAKNVPYKEKSAKATSFDSSLDTFDLNKLPVDRAAPMVIYCNAGECWKSYKATVLALRAGYKQVYWFRGGIPEWKSKKLPTE
jgi:rhodanese-related sulfurtransferase